MGRNFDPDRRKQQRWQQRRERWNRRFEHLPRELNTLRLRLRRAPNGVALGVFRGVAGTLGFSVCWTRIVGVFVLLMISSSVGANGFRVSLLVAGFFYLLAAVLMRGPETRVDGVDPTHHLDRDDDEEEADSLRPPPLTRGRSLRPAAVPYQQAPRVPRAPRVDFAALDRQLDGLNRRIQRMEGIVTDRHYDWDRRLES